MRLVTMPAVLVLLLMSVSSPAADSGAPGLSLHPVEQTGNTPVLWLESAHVHSDWQGANLSRVVDEQTGEPCLEWYQNPATHGEALLTLSGIDPSHYDALRVEWKYEGGGARLQIQVGRRNWYLEKEKYKPGEWQDTWLDLRLDDDQGGPLLNDKGELVVRLIFANSAMNRPDEQVWRRIRLCNLRLVKFPVRLDCDPKQVASLADENSLSTVYPLNLKNATDRPQSVQLFLDPSRMRLFTARFETERLTLVPGESKQVRLTFSAPRDQAASLPPLYFEETPVYAMVEGDPLSTTTWYRGFAQYFAGGVVQPLHLNRPYLVPKVELDSISDKDRAGWMSKADAALKKTLVLPELRHGYPSDRFCPIHHCSVQYDLVNFRSHYCPVGKHYIVGDLEMDKTAAMCVHTANSNACCALGWAYHFTGGEKYARKAAEILLAYAAGFPHWDYANPATTGHHSRIGHAVLGECWFIHGLVTAYDLIANSPSLTAAQRTQIEQDLFLPEAEDIQTHRVGANMQCEINDASGGSAINAQNWYMAARAFTGTFGLFDQIALTFSADGFSRESELPYHFAAVGPIVQQGLVYEALGGTFFTPFVKRIFDAPIAYAPAGDPGYRTGYAMAYAHYHDPAYLFPGGDTPLFNSVLELAGRTTLRRGTAAHAHWMQIMWGSSTWRGGKDLLNYLTPLNTSISRIGYGAVLPTPALSYDTLGGNVPEVDGLTQTGVRARQTVIFGGDLPAAKYLAPRELAMYPDVGLSRVCAIMDDAYVVVDRLSSDRPRRYSFPFYPGGAPTATPGLTFAPYDKFQEEGATYKAITSPARATGVTSWTVDYAGKTAGKTPARMHCFLDGEGEVIQGITWNMWNPVQTSFFLTRRTASAVACVQVLEPGPEWPIRDLKVLPLTVDGKPVELWQGLAVSLTTPRGTCVLIDCDLPGLKSAAGASTKDSLWVGKAG